MQILVYKIELQHYTKQDEHTIVIFLIIHIDVFNMSDSHTKSPEESALLLMANQSSLVKIDSIFFNCIHILSDIIVLFSKCSMAIQHSLVHPRHCGIKFIKHHVEDFC